MTLMSCYTMNLIDTDVIRNLDVTDTGTSRHLKKAASGGTVTLCETVKWGDIFTLRPKTTSSDIITSTDTMSSPGTVTSCYTVSSHYPVPFTFTVASCVSVTWRKTVTRHRAVR